MQECRKVEIVAHSLVSKPGVADSSLNSVVEIPTDNIYFLPNKPILAPESLPYVERLVDNLRSYKNCRILIIGHINSQSQLESTERGSLFKLSNDRAKVIFEILSEHGIPKDIMTFKSIGNVQPAISDPKT